MPESAWKDLPALLSVGLIFGGGILWLIVRSLAENWRMARVAEQNAVLKRAMLDKGFTADEIERVIHAGGDLDGKMVAKSSRT